MMTDIWGTLSWLADVIENFIQWGITKDFDFDHWTMAYVKMSAISIIFLNCALLRDSPAFRWQFLPWLRWSRYAVSCSCIVCFFSYATTGWARHMPIIFLFFSISSLFISQRFSVRSVTQRNRGILRKVLLDNSIDAAVIAHIEQQIEQVHNQSPPSLTAVPT
jgi:hypothetical protein